MTTSSVRGIAILVLLGSLALAACAPAAPSATPTSQPAAKGTAPTEVAKPAIATQAPPTATPKPVTLKMATPNTGIADMAQQFAQRKGFYGQEGITAEITQMSSDLSVKALVGGGIDFVFSFGSTVRGAATGLPVKAVLGSITKPYHVLVVRPEIKEGKDLKGKSFGVDSIAGTTALEVRIALKHFGLDPEKDATFVVVGGNNERLASLKSNAVQGSIVENLYAVRAENQGMKQMLFMADVTDMALAGLGTSDKMIKENPDLVLRTVRATVKALKYIKDPANKDEVIDYMVSTLGATKAEAEQVYPDIVRVLSDDGMVPEDTVMQNDVKSAIEQAGANPNTKISDVFDYSFVNRVKAGN